MTNTAAAPAALAAAAAALDAAEIRNYAKQITDTRTILIAYSQNDGLDVVFAVAGTDASVRVTPMPATPNLYAIEAR